MHQDYYIFSKGSWIPINPSLAPPTGPSARGRVSKYVLLLVLDSGFNIGNGHSWMLWCGAFGRADGLQAPEFLWLLAAQRCLCRLGNNMDGGS